MHEKHPSFLCHQAGYDCWVWSDKQERNSNLKNIDPAPTGQAMQAA